MTAQITWEEPRDYTCRHLRNSSPDVRTYGTIGGREVAMVKEEDYVSKHGDKEHVHGWSMFVYLKPWPRHRNEDRLYPTKEEAQAACQQAVDALTKLLTTGTADPDFEWI